MKTWREIDGWFDYLCQVAGLGVEAQAFQATLIAQRALKPNAAGERLPAKNV